MLKRLTLLVAVVAVSAIGLPAGADGVPESCAKDPVYDPETERLVETTYYFHSDSAVGDLDGYQGFFGSSDGQYMDTTAPTGDTPKVDSNASRAIYPAPLPGNPIMTAFLGYLDFSVEIACIEWNVWVAGEAQGWELQLWADQEFILGEGGATVTYGAGSDGISQVAGSLVPNTRVGIDYQVFAQMEALASPAVVLYDAVDSPSGVTLVHVEPIDA